jgi:hypothetical protein
VVYYTEVLDCTVVAHYCTVVALHTVVHCYTVVVLQTVAHYYTMVVLETVAWYYTMVVVHYYTVVVAQVVLSLTHPAPYMHLMSSPSLSPRFCSPCLHVQLTCKNYKMYSLVLSDTSASWDNDRDHAHVFCISHTMVLLKIKDLAYLLLYTAQIMDTHSYDDLLSCIMYTKHLLFSPYLYSDSTEMLSSSDLVSALPQLDLSAYIDFPLTVRLLAGPQPDFGTFFVSKDTSNVAIKS